MKEACTPVALMIAIVLAAVGVAEARAQDQAAAVGDDAALELANEQLDRIADYRAQLEALETEFGPFDPILLEPLAGLTDALIEAGEFEQARGLLSRRQQLLRTADGLSNPDQLPVLAQAIANSIRLGEWNNVTEHFQFIQWLQVQEGADLETQLRAMDDVALWQMNVLNLGHPRSRVRNFLQARQLQREMVWLAEGTWGEDNPELIPWLYRQAVNQYRLSEFLNAPDELGYDARQEILQMEYMSSQDYLRRGLNIVKRIRDLVDMSGNAEAAAIAMIYEADFQRLLDLGTSISVYRDAAERLQQAGIDGSRVDAFFARTVILPLPEFVESLDQLEALAASWEVTEPRDLGDQEFNLDIGRFVAWNESLLTSRLPALPESAASLSINLNTVDLSFTVNSRGEANNPRVIQAEPENVRMRRDVRDAVRRLQFRPLLEDGRPRRMEKVLLRFQYPSRQQE